MPSLFSPFLLLRPTPPLTTTTSTRLLHHHRRHHHRRITMSTASANSTVIDHVVLFNVNPTADPTQMLASLNSLSTLPFVLHLTAGPIRRLHSPFPALHFTHLLHSRHRSASDLESYSSHPNHLSAVRSHVLPICLDIMSLDWKSSIDSVSGTRGSAIRVQFVKVKEGLGEKEKEEVMEVIGGVKGKKVEGLGGVSYGVNFSPARAKGFGIGVIGFFDGVKELEEVSESEVVEKEKERVRGYIDGVIVADYVVLEKAAAGSASL